jgi:ATP-dependent Lon protease
MINPILKDRMVTIRVSGYNKAQKLIIARDYLMPSILAEYNLTNTDIQIANDVIEYIIERVDEEEGVRNLRRGLDAVVGAINMHRYVPPLIALPVIVSDGDVKKYIKLSEDPTKMRSHLRHTMYT